MPVEVKRKTHVQWITPLNIAMNVIDEITFVDPDEQFQQFTWTLNNPYRLTTDTMDTSTRKTHSVGFIEYDTDPVPGYLLDPGVKGSLNLEIIDKMKIIDSREREQEYWYTFGNPDDPSGPVNPPKHLKTHVSTIVDNLADFPINSSNYPGYPLFLLILAVQRIDEISFTDPNDQHRETIYKLDWSKEAEGDLNLVIPADQYNDLTTSTIPPPPIRLDPFQTIVGVNEVRLMSHGHVTWTDTRGHTDTGFDPVDVGDLKSGQKLILDLGISSGPDTVTVVDFDEPTPGTWRKCSPTEFFGGIYPDATITQADGKIQTYGAPATPILYRQDVGNQGYINYRTTVSNVYCIGWVKKKINT